MAPLERLHFSSSESFPSARCFGRLALVFCTLLAFSLPLGAKDKDSDDEEKKDDRPQTAEDLTPEMRAEITPVPVNRINPYQPGMRLVYEIGWGWFDVGTAILTVEEDEFEGEPALKFTLEARTNGFADAFYKVRNTTTAWTDPEMTRTLHYTNLQNEGKRQRDVVVDFAEGDEMEPLVNYHNRENDDARPYIPILENTWDPMAITFYVSTLPMAEDSRIVIPTTNGKELFLTYIDVVDRKRKKFDFGGKQEVFVLEPDIKDLGGVFRKSDDSEVRFYFAAEGPQFPLRMESSVAVGKFWAELDRIETITED
jgi:hypothetical protein